jgi:hypothetical protein
MKDYRDAEAAWQRARDLAAKGDGQGAAELVVEVAAFYERGRFLVRAKAAGQALDRVVPELGDGLRGARSVWAVLDDCQLGPGEHVQLERLLTGS